VGAPRTVRMRLPRPAAMALGMRLKRYVPM
jgi:hypothetical protein